MTLEFPYKKVLPANADGVVEYEEATLVIETRIGKIADHEDINNPTEDPEAFFYALTIDGGRETLQTFQPGEEGYQSMTEDEAEDFLQQEVDQACANYWITK